MGGLFSSHEEDGQEFTREVLINGIKEKKYKKVVFLTGAGISVAAGIPDFRTPGSGLYSKVQSLNLPYPEALFSIDYFKERPEAFYTFAKAFMSCMDAKPVLAHHFIRMFNEEGILHRSYTQNVDGLELEAGVDPGKLIEAHGHLRSAHCIKCNKKYTVEEFKKAINDEQILKCSKCNSLVKPDVTFFGEALPASFYLNIFRIKSADLAIVMGTSLTVYPFASLIDQVPKNVPMVLINREQSMSSRKKFLFLGGDIEEVVGGLIKDLGWENKLPEDLRAKLKE